MSFAPLHQIFLFVPKRAMNRTCLRARLQLNNASGHHEKDTWPLPLISPPTTKTFRLALPLIHLLISRKFCLRYACSSSLPLQLQQAIKICPRWKRYFLATAYNTSPKENDNLFDVALPRSHLGIKTILLAPFSRSFCISSFLCVFPKLDDPGSCPSPLFIVSFSLRNDVVTKHAPILSLLISNPHYKRMSSIAHALTLTSPRL
ncbi:hypothetical protein DE146DRAFT_236085 [Phaeosphaeria sp. MPI-PUGE-AT-0046c]|nr:hypothetical protein DE146DRAFT_236085 [Phaeosphaeria sp. MPI-PUGE-AT-0046c]